MEGQRPARPSCCDWNNRLVYCPPITTHVLRHASKRHSEKNKTMRYVVFTWHLVNVNICAAALLSALKWRVHSTANNMGNQTSMITQTVFYLGYVYGSGAPTEPPPSSHWWQTYGQTATLHWHHIQQNKSKRVSLLTDVMATDCITDKGIHRVKKTPFTYLIFETKPWLDKNNGHPPRVIARYLVSGIRVPTCV